MLKIINMVAQKKMMTPAEITEELRQMKVEIMAEELTPEGKDAILSELDKIRSLLMEMKMQHQASKVSKNHNA
jgi:ribosomal protein L29